MALRQIIIVCYDYGAEHDIVFNAKKSYRVVFKPKTYKLNCPTVSLSETVIPNLNSVKNLGLILTDNLQDDWEIMKQTRSLYAHGDVLLRKLGLCSSEVKQELFQSYCANFYCCSLWTIYNKTTYSKVKVAYNNIAHWVQLQTHC